MSKNIPQSLLLFMIQRDDQHQWITGTILMAHSFYTRTPMINFYITRSMHSHLISTLPHDANIYKRNANGILHTAMIIRTWNHPVSLLYFHSTFILSHSLILNPSVHQSYTPIVLYPYSYTILSSHIVHNLKTRYNLRSNYLPTQNF